MELGQTIIVSMVTLIIVVSTIAAIRKYVLQSEIHRQTKLH